MTPNLPPTLLAVGFFRVDVQEMAHKITDGKSYNMVLRSASWSAWRSLLSIVARTWWL
jgi:hypothetical protein